MNQKDGQENTPNWRAIYILAVPMAVAIAMRQPACGQQAKNGTLLLGPAKRS